MSTGTGPTPGPQRFAPSKEERTIQEQLANLTKEEKECFDYLKQKWDKKHPGEPFTDEMILRFAYCSPGTTKFNQKTSWKVMKKFDRKFLGLKASDIEDQLLSKTLFPIPDLKTLEGGHSMFYMRPSRYFPKQTSTTEIIDNLAYVMTTMMESNEKSSKEGIGFMAYMDEWKMTNFSVDYCFQFMMMLQGKIPARVRLFLIVNPPGWFGTIWSIMKPMLAKDFRKKVHVIQETEISKYLMDGYEKYLPDEMKNGQASTDGIIQDYIAYRKSVEKD